MPLNELGIAIRVKRIANRRGKSASWARKRFQHDLKRHRTFQQEQTAKMKEAYEEMQRQMLQGEKHEHEGHEHESK